MNKNYCGNKKTYDCNILTLSAAHVHSLGGAETQRSIEKGQGGDPSRLPLQMENPGRAEAEAGNLGSLGTNAEKKYRDRVLEE